MTYGDQNEFDGVWNKAVNITLSGDFNTAAWGLVQIKNGNTDIYNANANWQAVTVSGTYTVQAGDHFIIHCRSNGTAEGGMPRGTITLSVK